jgi:hypothetical protein
VPGRPHLDAAVQRPADEQQDDVVVGDALGGDG